MKVKGDVKEIQSVSWAVLSNSSSGYYSRGIGDYLECAIDGNKKHVHGARESS